MDHFQKLPVEIYDEILQHFSVDELLNVISFINSEWNEKVGNSVLCMQKIKLNLRSKRKNDFSERIDTLRWLSRRNSRKYADIQSNCLFDERISFEFWNFLKSRNTSDVEKLNLRSMKLNEELSEVVLPKLEHLKLMFVPREATNHLLLSTCNLKKLILWNENTLCYDDINYDPSPATIECIKKSMTANVKIEELEIQGRAHFFAFFRDDISAHFKSSIKKLTVKVEMSPHLIKENYVVNFIKFLTSQKDNLEYIYIDALGADVLAYIFQNIPNIKSIRFDVELKEPNRFNIQDLNIPINRNVTSLELPYIKEFDDLKDYLDLVPNVKNLLIGHVTPRLLEHVVKNLSQLESLVYRYDICALGCEKLYEKMKSENQELNANINISVCNDFM